MNALSHKSDTTVDNKRVDDQIQLKDNNLIEIGQRKFIFHSLTPRICDEPKKERAPTAYNLFMKDEIVRLKEADSSLNHKAAFKKAADNWAAERIRKAFEQLDAAHNANEGKERECMTGANDGPAETPAVVCNVARRVPS